MAEYPSGFRVQAWGEQEGCRITDVTAAGGGGSTSSTEQDRCKGQGDMEMEIGVAQMRTREFDMLQDTLWSIRYGFGIGESYMFVLGAQDPFLDAIQSIHIQSDLGSIVTA